MQAQIEELRRQLEAAGTREIPTKLIRVSRFYNRYALDMVEDADPDFRLLASSIRSQGGNAIPALVHQDQGKNTYELVYGHRRWAACKAAKLPLTTFVVSGLSLKELARHQLLENSSRKSLSILDRARQVVSQMKAGAWAEQQDLAATVGISEQYVSMLLRIGRDVPDAVQMVHPNHHKVTYKQARRIADIARRPDGPAELKRRIEWVRARKGKNLSAESATNYLIYGRDSAPTTGPRVATWAATKTGVTLKVRGMTAATALKLSTDIELLLEAAGLTVDGEEAD